VAEAKLCRLQFRDGNVSIARIGISFPYTRYVNVRFGSVTCSALVDSGNEWGCIITGELAARLGYSPRSLLPTPGGQRHIGTAKEGSHLTILGRIPGRLYFTFKDAPKAGHFPIQPTVVKDACMDFNMSGPYLQHFGIDQIHTANALRVRGHMVPLFARPSAIEGRRHPRRRTQSGIQSGSEITSTRVCCSHSDGSPILPRRSRHPPGRRGCLDSNHRSY
jgi:hypothetical protein